MPPYGSSQRTDNTSSTNGPATFQAVVAAAMIAVMAQLSANNTNWNENGANNSNHGDNQGHQRVCSCKDTPNYKPKNSNNNGEVVPKKWKLRKRVVRIRSLPKDNKLWHPIPPLSLLPQFRRNHMVGTCLNATSVTSITLDFAKRWTTIIATERGISPVSIRHQHNKPPKPQMLGWVRPTTDVRRQGILIGSAQRLEIKISEASRDFQKRDMWKRRGTPLWLPVRFSLK